MIAVKYTFFAIISTLLNLTFQYLSFMAYKGFASLYIGMFIGTLVGLVSKYILDKKYIFYHTSKNKSDDAKKFILYSLVGVFTTIIFWGTEIGFDQFWSTEKIVHLIENTRLDSKTNHFVTKAIGISGEYAKYIGAVIGLSIGYVTKYFLDKKYVFKHQTL